MTLRNARFTSRYCIMYFNCDDLKRCKQITGGVCVCGLCCVERGVVAANRTVWVLQNQCAMNICKSTVTAGIGLTVSPVVTEVQLVLCVFTVGLSSVLKVSNRSRFPAPFKSGHRRVRILRPLWSNKINCCSFYNNKSIKSKVWVWTKCPLFTRFLVPVLTLRLQNSTQLT